LLLAVPPGCGTLWLMKKLAIAFVASVFALALAAPTADACPGMEKDKNDTTDTNKVVKKDTKKPTKIAKKDSKKSDDKKATDKKAKKN